MTILGTERRQRARLRLAALALVGLFFGGLLVAASAQAQSGPRLLMLPIVVHSAEDPEYLRDGLSDMLAARFDRIGALEILRAPAGGRGATDQEAALKLARKAGADYVLYGSFTRFGQGASLDVQCAPVSAATDRKPLREIFVHSGSIGEIIPDLDELAGKVSRFARGENVESSRPTASAAAGASASATTAASNAAINALSSRVEALETALRELLARTPNTESLEAGTGDELR